MTALFITLNDLKKSTAINGNVDSTKLLPSLKAAQEIEILDTLGTDLYNKISDDIINDTLSGDTLTLVQSYIHPVMIHYAVSYYLPFSTYQITNGGVSKWNGGENFDSIEKSELDYLVNKETAMAETYKQRLITELKNNEDKYPDYFSNDDATDIKPNENTNRTGLFLN